VSETFDWDAFHVDAGRQAEAFQTAVGRALDEMWNPPTPPARVPDVPDPFCKASLFELDDSLRNAIRLEIITWGIAVHPVEAAFLNAPVQGPAPLRCALLPHPDSPWHWDGQGTWFR
jgi:hypothetical protein